VIDVSGSMYYDLPEIRKNLKNKISSLVKENDTVSIIWFSGKNDAGILKEEVHVNSLKQLNDLNDAIDRFLKPIGLTAFAKPLELADDVIRRIQSNNPESIFSLIFMSDGWNNDVSWDSVINVVNKNFT
jgi:Mg-chelatase subunit ChlD